LAAWREDKAKKINIPRQHLLKDELIEKIVNFGLENQNLEKKFDEQMILEISNITKSSQEIQASSIMFYLNDQQKTIYKEIKKLISKIAFKENFREQFLLTSFEIKKMISNQKFFNEIVFGWRKQLFGMQIENLIQSEKL